MVIENRQKIMIIEDDEMLTSLILRTLSSTGYEIVTYTNGSEALKSIAIETPKLLLLDYSLRDITANDFLSNLKAKNISIPFLIMTGHGDENIAVEMMKMGAAEYLIKDTRFIDFLPIKVENILNDIDEKLVKNKMETEYLEREKMLNSIISASHDAIMMIDDALHIQFYNPSADKLLNNDVGSMQGMQIIDFFHESQKELILKLISSIKNNSFNTKKCVIETLIKSIKTNYIPVEVQIISIMHNEKKIVVFIIKDISERTSTAEKLEESWKLLKTVIENISIQVCVKDVHTRKILFSNNWCHQFTHISTADMIDKTDFDLFPIEIAESFKASDEEVIQKGEIDVPELLFINLNGEQRFIHSHKLIVKNNEGSPLYILSTLEDITEDKKNQVEQRDAVVWLHEKQKMEALGTMAGGICHEINNPLTGIMNYAQLIADLSDDDSIIKEFACEIISESERIASIIGSLQGLCKRDSGQRGPTDLIDVMANVEQLVKTTFRHDKIKLNVEIDHELPKVYGNVEQYQHLMLNMLTNARDALNDRFTGADPQKCVEIKSQISDNYVILTVKDYGFGVSDYIKVRMFDPFFTTHDRTERRGLGLAICYSIICGYGGDMQVDSKMDEYTKFIISFPIDADSERHILEQ